MSLSIILSRKIYTDAFLAKILKTMQYQQRHSVLRYDVASPAIRRFYSTLYAFWFVSQSEIACGGCYFFSEDSDYLMTLISWLLQCWQGGQYLNQCIIALTFRRLTGFVGYLQLFRAHMTEVCASLDNYRLPPNELCWFSDSPLCFMHFKTLQV